MPLDCCCERVGLYPGRRPSERHPARPSGRAGHSEWLRELIGMEVLYGRVAGLDIGKASLTVSVDRGVIAQDGLRTSDPRGDDRW